MCLLKSAFRVVLLSLLLTHCVSMGERTVRMNTGQIQQKLNQKLAKSFTVLKVFHIQLSNALVSMDPVSGRIHTLMDAHVQSDLLADAATGKISLSGLVKFDQARQAVVLDQPTVDHLQLDGAQAEWQGLVQQLAQRLGSKWLDQLVLYEVKPEDLSYAGRLFQPTALQVTAEGLQVTLKPK